MLRKGLTTFALAAAGLFTAEAHAFEAFGLRSGMTAREVEAAAPMGFGLRMLTDSSGVVAKDHDLFVFVAFCQGRLVAVSRDIDPEVDYVETVEAALRQRGQPQVLTESQPWPGPGGGFVRTVTLRWLADGERYDITLSPEGRDGQGKLRHTRDATARFFRIKGNPCATTTE